ISKKRRRRGELVCTNKVKMSSEFKGPAQEIDPRIKNYIDEAFQATITTLVDKSLTSEEQNNQSTPATVNSPSETRDDQAAGCTRVHKPNSS
ncbi:11687_t:CDS:2, partial [Gigaspora rosea]